VICGGCFLWHWLTLIHEYPLSTLSAHLPKPIQTSIIFDTLGHDTSRAILREPHASGTNDLAARGRFGDANASPNRVHPREQLDGRPNLIFPVTLFSRSISRISQVALDNLRVLPIALCLMASADSHAQTTAPTGAIAGGVFVVNSDGTAYIPGAKIILQGPELLQTETD